MNIHRLHILFALLLLASCAPSKNPRAFARWMDAHKKELSASVSCEVSDITFSYVPAAWVMCNAEGSNHPGTEQFIMEVNVKREINDVDLFNQSLVQYADLEMSRDLMLYRGDQAMLCQVCQIESNFMTKGRYKFILLFEGVLDPGQQTPLRIEYADRVFGCSGSTLSASFDELKLTDIPQLDCPKQNSN